MIVGIFTLGIILLVVIVLFAIFIGWSREEARQCLSIAQRAINAASELDSEICFAWVKSHNGEDASEDYEKSRETFKKNALGVERDIQEKLSEWGE